MTDLEPKMDLLETRRQLVAARSLYSNNWRVVIEINKLIGKIAHLHRPVDLAHEKRLIEMITQTWRAVDLILAQDQAAGVPRVNRPR